MTLRIREFTGSDAELVNRAGRAKSPETIAIMDALAQSATSGTKVEIADLTPRELERLKARIGQIAQKNGYIYRSWTSPEGLVIEASFKEEVEPEPVEEVKPQPRARARKQSPK